MKNLKKSCVMLLALLLLFVVGCLPNEVKAAESDFVIDEKGVLTEYQGNGGDVVIPDGVTAIGVSAFSGCSRLTTVSIPDGVTSIGGSAFGRCYNLVSISIPDTVNFIGSAAFSQCQSLTSITIPKGVTVISTETFYQCSNLSSVSLPEGLTSIHFYAFFSCTSLTSITIPDGVGGIGASAFKRNSNLRSISIPDSVGFIGNEAFYGCSKLNSFSIPQRCTYISGSAFYGCSGLTSIDIPDSVTSIASFAFGDCTNLKFISIPSSTNYICDKAFINCNSLESAYIYNKEAILGIASGSSITSPIFGENNTFITLHGYKDSTTELCAKEWGYKFEALPDDTNKPLQGISLNKTTIVLNQDQTSLLKVIYNPVDTTDSTSVKWSSSNPSVARVYTSGKVKGVASGAAIITATVGDKTATCSVTVR